MAYFDDFFGTKEADFYSDTIVLKKYEPACIFCGSMDNASLFRGKIICDKCLSELKKTDCDNADS